MKLLLDTHVALWAITEDARLNDQAKSLITAPDHEVWVSVASLWEIGIKHSLGRGHMPLDAEQALRWFTQAGMRILDIQSPHVLAVVQLPHHHQDPFDRLLVAQALSEPLHLITHDAMVARYDDHIMLI